MLGLNIKEILGEVSILAFEKMFKKPVYHHPKYSQRSIKLSI